MFYNNEPSQWNTSAISDPNGFSYNSVNHNHTANGKVKGVKVTGYVKAVKPRKLLIDKARSVIQVKLEEMKSTSKAEKNRTTTKKILTIPNPDFHDFDSDRSEEVFQVKQIWAIYDEEDGMPRLYCLIPQVMSVKPFWVHISYLSSKTDTEFGNVKWIES
ncbi:dnaJ domain-containing protein [Artemisia annua]|uniref:DnaJ domain-containing protein n=1 Tax=Artemisia annua TaxID=35608 RepID=A0A2U1NK20_ARTAN|nr:dnaJ domain-containing protein [Artemisia annua]